MGQSWHPLTAIRAAYKQLFYRWIRASRPRCKYCGAPLSPSSTAQAEHAKHEDAGDRSTIMAYDPKTKSATLTPDVDMVNKASGPYLVSGPQLDELLRVVEYGHRLARAVNQYLTTDIVQNLGAIGRLQTAYVAFTQATHTKLPMIYTREHEYQQWSQLFNTERASGDRLARRTRYAMDDLTKVITHLQKYLSTWMDRNKDNGP